MPSRSLETWTGKCRHCGAWHDGRGLVWLIWYVEHLRDCEKFLALEQESHPRASRRRRADPVTAHPRGQAFVACVPGGHSMASGNRVRRLPSPEQQLAPAAEADDAELDAVELLERGGLDRG